jgi:hypothetical protein
MNIQDIKCALSDHDFHIVDKMGLGGNWLCSYECANCGKPSPNKYAANWMAARGRCMDASDALGRAIKAARKHNE